MPKYTRKKPRPLVFDTAATVEATEADAIENVAVHRAYLAKMGTGEWEAFLTPEETARLIELADAGFGTWGREPKLLERIKQLQAESETKG